MDEPGTQNLATHLQELWEREPIQAFERLRDQVCDALDIVVAVHREATGAKAKGKDFSLAELDANVRARLDQSLNEARVLFHNVRLARFLDRADGPVYLDNLPERSHRVSGSSFHDLVLAVGNGLQDAIEAGMTAVEFARDLRFRTAAGENVSQHIAGLKPKVRCETMGAIQKWRDESRSAPVTAATVNLSENANHGRPVPRIAICCIPLFSQSTSCLLLLGTMRGTC